MSKGIANDMVDAIVTGTRKWTRQKKSEERHPGMIRYRMSRMTKTSRISQKAAAWSVMEAAYMAASADDTLPAMARQIYYQARPKVMALTEDKALQYGYFSQTLLPDYIEEHPEAQGWKVVYDARGHFEEPHTGRSIGCGTIEVDSYLDAMSEPSITPPDFSDARLNIVGPSGNLAGVLFCEKEGFGPLFRQVNLANRYDLMIISTKGVSVTAARKLIDEICGDSALPLFVLHDFDVAGFTILGTLHRDTRRYQFDSSIEPIDLGLRLADIEGLEHEPAAATKTRPRTLRAQLVRNGATPEEIEILLKERVELNAMTSANLIAMIERKLKAFGLKKVIPDDELLDQTYRDFRYNNALRKVFAKAKKEFDATHKASKVTVAADLRKQVKKVLKASPGFRWDDAIRIVLGEKLNRVQAAKQTVKKASGDFTKDKSDEWLRAAVTAVLGEGFESISGDFTDAAEDEEDGG
jgi:hypothetical protein